MNKIKYAEGDREGCGWIWCLRYTGKLQKKVSGRIRISLELRVEGSNKMSYMNNLR